MMDRISRITVAGLIVLSVSLSGCGSVTSIVTDVRSERFIDRDAEEVSLCKALHEHHTWLDGAVAAERRWGVPIWVSLAELNMPLGTEASQYIAPLDSDWQTYRIETERWQADKGDVGAALDFLGWHAQLAVERNKLALDQAGQLYLAARLGHGGYHRLQYQPDLLLTRQAEQVQQTALSYREQLKQCAGIRKRADSFLRWPW